MKEGLSRMISHDEGSFEEVKLPFEDGRACQCQELVAC